MKRVAGYSLQLAMCLNFITNQRYLLDTIYTIDNNKFVAPT